MQVYNIPIANDLQEVTMHGDKNFPLAVYKTQLSKNVLGHLPLHWHDEMQFVYVLEGCACYNIEQKKYYIEKNNGLFINSSRLHTGHIHNTKDCIYICFDISPDFFASAENIIKTKYVNSFISSNSISAIKLSCDVDWQREILDNLHHLYKIYNDKKFGYEIDIYAQFHKILHSLIINTPIVENDISSSLTDENKLIKKMLLYINQSYKEKITLDDIARCGNISKSQCCRFFKKMTHQTPFEYLIAYRISQSIHLLRQTDLSVTQIANEVGFGSVSYYIDKFRTQTKYTPKQFRNKSDIRKEHV